MEHNHLQALVDGMSEQWKRERAETQMTLGSLIDKLEKLPEDLTIEGIHNPHSYRGYYCDLALEPTTDPVTVKELLQECRSVMGKSLMGYKGGDFVMGESTPLWVSYYGETGMKLMAINNDGTIETADDD